MKIILLKGLPSSGKSSWAKEMSEKGNFLVVSRDEIRKMLGGYKPSREKEALRIRNRLIEEAIKMRKNVIVDDTNLNPKHEQHIRKMARDLGCKFEVNDSFLKISPEECIRRDLHRGDKAVGADSIWQMYYKWLCPEPIKKLEKEKKKPRAVICDIDGTLSHNVRGRSYYDMTRVDEDTVDPFMSCVMDALYNYGIERDGNPYPSIILISGRSESGREKTERWLSDNMIAYDKLFLRADGDKRPDDIVKEEIYRDKIEIDYAILGVFDDRPSCVRMWQRLGLRVANMGSWGENY